MLKPEDWKQEGYNFPKSEEDRCIDPNCFSHAFKYTASSEQLKVSNNAIINNAEISIAIISIDLGIIYLGAHWSISYMQTKSEACLLD